jgi:DNA-binding NtrC family response regulator
VRCGWADEGSIPDASPETAMIVMKSNATCDGVCAKDTPSFCRGRMVGESPPILGIFEAIRKVSGTKTTVLIEGESGTGKELVAQAIHENSPWKKEPFVSVHCAALSPTLLESELFGHEKGAFTGAQERKIGRFERAQGGTLLLDEISEIPLEIQVKLLRVLQEREFERVGGTEALRMDLRIVAATNRPLEQRVADGLFREDLFYRLNVVTIQTPPLRSHPEDIPLLVNNLLGLICKRLSCPAKRLSPQSLEAFQKYSWPGNVRELQNLLEKAVVFSEGEILEMVPPQNRVPLPLSGSLKNGLVQTLEEVERTLILKALKESKGIQSQAARDLEVSRSALQYKIAKYKLESFCRETH